jgi:hypothetical protein
MGWTIGVLGFDSLHHRIQNGSGAHRASYPMGTGGSFPGGKAAGTWSWPLISIQCRGQRMNEAIPPLTHYAFMAWCSVKAQGQLYVYRTLSCNINCSVFYNMFPWWQDWVCTHNMTGPIHTSFGKWYSTRTKSNLIGGLVVMVHLLCHRGHRTHTDYEVTGHTLTAFLCVEMHENRGARAETVKKRWTSPSDCESCDTKSPWSSRWGYTFSNKTSQNV